MSKSKGRLRTAALRLRAVDAFCIVILVFFSLVAWLGPYRPESWWELVLCNLAGAVLVCMFRRLALRSRCPVAQMFFGMLPLLMFLWFWAEVGELQLAVRDRWFDEVLMAFEHRIFGVHLSLWLGRFVSVPITEWMLLGYFSYLPIIPIGAIVMFRWVRPKAMDSYLLAMAVGYIICYVGFLVFPLIGPMTTFADQYTVELKGYVGRLLTRLMEDYGMFPGGSLPSAHCAAGTVILLMCFKHHRRTFWVFLPAILTFFMATVYGRYHYVSDTVSGIAVGFVAFWLAPGLESLWQRLQGRIAETPTNERAETA